MAKPMILSPLTPTPLTCEACRSFSVKYHCLWAGHLTSPEACSSGRRLLPCSRGTELDVFCDFSFYLFLFSCSVVSSSLQPHGLQHTRLPCPSPSPGVCSNSCPLSQWCHPTISSSVAPFSFPQCFPASGSFPRGCLFISDGQTITASASGSVPPVNIQDWFPLGLTSSISLVSKGLSRVFFSTTVEKHQFFGTQPSLWSNSHIHTWLL